MNWDAIGAIAEVLGAIGVMGTLIFLAIETRKSAIATRQQSYHSIVTRRADMFDSYGRDNETAKILTAGWVGDDLEPLESLRFAWFTLNFMSHFQDIYMQYRAGTIEKDIWEAEKRMLAAVIDQPGFVSWWGESSQYFMPEFVEAVNVVEPVDMAVFDREARKWKRPGGVYKP